MKVLYYDEQKGYRAIRAGQMPAPEPGENEALVRVKAFSLNHLDLWVMNANYPVPVPLPHIFGSDASGVVEKAGSLVQHVKAGDPVIVFPGLSCGHCDRCVEGRDNECRGFSLLGTAKSGVSAEYLTVRAENLFQKPEGMSFEEAACTGITYATAWNSLVLRSGIRQGDTVVVHAAGSGAGSAAIQVAKLFHARIITTVGDDWKAARAREIGADVVINHRKEDLLEAVKAATGGQLADIVVDHVGAATFNASLSCLRRGGSLAVFGATSGDDVRISLRHLFGRNIRVHGVYVGPKAVVPQYLKLMPRELRPVIDSVFSFEDAQKAYEKLLSRQVFGKIVVTV